MAGIEIEAEFAERVVSTYRSKFSKVVSLWRDTEKAALQAMRCPGKVIPCGRVKFRFDAAKGFLLCRLPSGRLLKYPGAVIKQAKTSWGEVKGALHYKRMKEGRWVYTNTYGGKLVENIDQATSRDIMAGAMVRAEDNGYGLLITIHDELLSEVDESNPDLTLDGFCKLLSRRPSWGRDIPIEAEGWEGYRYRKA